MPIMHIREAREDEHEALGRLVAEAYAALAGMPGPDEQPGYYAMLRDVGARVRNPAIHVLVAIDGDQDAPLGCVDVIDDMSAYGAASAARELGDACGLRLLAVDPRARGRGAGKALTLACVERARTLGRARVVLHTTRAMTTAWAMYERLGFARLPAIDFTQGRLEVFGFELRLDR
jgi:ribosomal protein S18 acetylase RimI-like enzyme